MSRFILLDITGLVPHEGFFCLGVSACMGVRTVSGRAKRADFPPPRGNCSPS